MEAVRVCGVGGGEILGFFGTVGGTNLAGVNPTWARGEMNGNTGLPPSPLPLDAKPTASKLWRHNPILSQACGKAVKAQPSFLDLWRPSVRTRYCINSFK